jgi:MFS family permease
MWAVFFIQTFAIQMFQPSFQALVADSSGTRSRGRAFGNYNLFWIGSQIPAPLLGGFLIDTVGLRFPFLLASVISLVGLVTAFGLVEVSHGQTAAQTAASNGGVHVEEPVMPYVQVMLIFGVMAVLNGLLNGMLSPLLKGYLVNRLHTTATELGLAFSIGSGLVTTLVQIPGGMLTDSVGRKPLMLFSMLGAPFVVALAFTGTVPQFILATAGLVAFGNLSAPAYYAWMMDLVPSAKRARTSGIMNTITGMGLFIGPQLSNWIYESQGNIVLAFFATAMPWILQTPLILKLKETKSS